MFARVTEPAVCGDDCKIILVGIFPDGAIGRAAGKARARDVDGAGKELDDRFD